MGEKIKEKKEEKNKSKTNSKVIRWIFVVIGICIIIYLIFIIRNMIILNVLHNKNIAYNDYDNIYAKIVSEKEDGTVTIAEMFYKDDVEKTIIDIKGNRFIQIETLTEHKFFAVNQKKAMISKLDYPAYRIRILDLTGSDYGLIGLVRNAAINLITSENIDGIECYKITGPLENILAVSSIKGYPSVYIEKDTGLPIMYEQTLKDGRTIKTTYEYKFNIVTDEDIKEPDMSEYEIEE